jgi:tetratricopeptide (TPR) repeat protein
MADLAKALLPARIRGLYEGRRSGVLVARQPGVTKAVFFHQGQVVFASSTLEKEKLGENLIRLGRISRADFLAAVQANEGRKRRIGQALVEAGLIGDDELGRIVAHQVQKIVVSIFTWTSGEATFHESSDAIPEDLALDVSTARLLFEGCRIFPDVARLEEALPPAGQRMHVVTRPPFDHAAMALSPAEREVLEACADEQAVGEITGSVSGPRRELRVRALYGLLMGGIVEPRGAAHEEAEMLDVDTGTFRLALTPDEQPPAEDLRTRILRLYEALPRASHYEVLDVPPDAAAADIEAAHERLLEAERGWKSVEGEARLASLVSTLRLRRRQAHMVLSDAHRRQAYDRSLGSVKPARMPLHEPPGLPSLEANDPKRKAQQLTRDAQEAARQGQRDKAISLLLESVRLEERDYVTRRLLAVLLAEHATLQKSAERHFRTALELEPGDVDLRYKLAAFYKKAGFPGRAMGELQAVFAQDPAHKDAHALMRVLKKTSG